MVKYIARALLTFLLAIALFMPVSADAAKCQGLSSGRCKSNSGCVWVRSHSRKGKQVKAYCRAKPTRSGITKKKSSVSKKRRVTKKKKLTKKKKTTKKRRILKKKRKTTKKKKTKKRKIKR